MAAPALAGVSAPRPWTHKRALRGWGIRSADVRSRPEADKLLGLPQEVEHWSLATLREKLVKIGAKVASHGRYITFQLAEVAIPRSLFANILRLIDGLRPAPLPP